MKLPVRTLPLLAGLCCPTAEPATAQRSPSDTLLADLDARLGHPGGSSDPEPLRTAGGRTWVLATTPATGRELWVTDGTPAGTLLLGDFDGTERSSFRDFARLPDGSLLLASEDSTHGTELFVKAPGAATRWSVLKDIFPGPAGSTPEHLTLWNGACWFIARAPSAPTGLWRTDGTREGTRLVEDLTPSNGQGSGRVRDLAAGTRGLWIAHREPDRGLMLKAEAQSASRAITAGGSNVLAASLWQEVGGRMLFVESAGFQGGELWSSDGTDTGTLQITNPLLDYRGRLEPQGEAEGRLWFVGQHFGPPALYVTDGTAAGTTWVTDPFRGSPADEVPLRPGAAVPAFGGAVFYGKEPGLSGRHGIYFSDGTPGSTRLITALEQPVQPGQTGSISDHQGAIWFTGYDAEHGHELWRTDGTTARRVLDLNPGPGSSNARLLASHGDTLLIAGNDGSTGIEPWRFVPSTGRTERLANLAPDPRNAGHGVIAPYRFRNRGLFLGSRDGTWWELFATDGRTAAGTVPLGGPTFLHGSIRWLGELRDGALFVGHAWPGVDTIFSTDGSAGSVHTLAEVLVGGPGDYFWHPGVTFDDALWFFDEFGYHPQQLWRSDGTPQGTGPVDWFPAGVVFRPALAHGGLLYGVGEEALGAEPWVTDGTPAGTRRVVDLAPGAEGSRPEYESVVGDRVVFYATSRATGREPYATDGTATGTVLLADIAPGPADSGLSDGSLVLVDGSGLFSARGATGAAELWRTDGTPGSTRRVLPSSNPATPPYAEALVATGDRALFRAPHPDGTPGFWTTDGTAEGTLPAFRDADLGGELVSLPRPVGDGRHAVFTVWRPGTGQELWVTDGTGGSGTRLLRDVRAGPASSRTDRRSKLPRHVFRVADQLLFEADDGIHGAELHRIALADFGGAVASPIGSSCGPELTTRGVPRIGMRFGLVVRGAADAPVGLFAGAEPAFGGPRPDCQIHVFDPTPAALLCTSATGVASLRLDLPPDPALVGLLLYLQAGLVRPGAPLGGTLELTQGLELLIGR